MSLCTTRHSIVCLLCIAFLCTLISPSVSADIMQLNINQDNCVKCHKRNGIMYGAHGSDSLSQTCHDCHGDKGSHPRKTNDLIIGYTAKAKTAVTDQTQTCVTCHDPQTLSSVEWTHDVHSNKVNCADCHQLHSESDPMIGIPTNERSAMCANCHNEQ